MLKLKKGLRVRISPASDYISQTSAAGVVGKKEGGRNWWRVNFRGGYSNVYRPQDLILAEPEPWTLKLKNVCSLKK